MTIRNKYKIGDVVYINSDINQTPQTIIAITVYSDEYHTYKLNSKEECADYRDYEI
jgi:hypothetical protein